MAFQTMKNLLPQRLKQTGLARLLAAVHAIQSANQVLNEWFGSQTSQERAQAISVRNKQLSVASIDSALRYELKRRESDFLAAVNKLAGPECVTALRVIV